MDLCVGMAQAARFSDHPVHKSCRTANINMLARSGLRQVALRIEALCWIPIVEVQASSPAKRLCRKLVQKSRLVARTCAVAQRKWRAVADAMIGHGEQGRDADAAADQHRLLCLWRQREIVPRQSDQQSVAGVHRTMDGGSPATRIR